LIHVRPRDNHSQSAAGPTDGRIGVHMNARTLIDCAHDVVATNPDSPAFLGEAGPVTHGALLADAEALAAALADQGLRPGAVVAFQLPNWPEAAVINLAASRLGLICMPLVPLYRETELAFMLNDSRCSAVFIPGTFRVFDFDAMYDRLLPQLTIQPRVIKVRDPVGQGLHYEELIASNRGRECAWPGSSPQAVKLRLYTSGTTGRPKAVLHDYRTLAHAIAVTVSHWGIRPGDVVLMPSPVTHATGYANALEMPFLHGTRTLLMDHWDAQRAAELIDTFGVTVTVGATPFLQELVATAVRTGTRLPSLRVFACGGASVPTELIEQANRVFMRQPAFRAYGSSEAPYVAIGGPPRSAAERERAARTDGQVVDYDIRIVDDTGAELPCGCSGEIQVRGPAMFLGYADPNDNADCLTPDGFFKTGDIGLLESDGWLTITGRKKDLIIRGGTNISPREIEDLLHLHPGVAEAAVVAMPHERLGEGVFAFIIANRDSTPDLESLLQHLRGHGISRQKLPEAMAVVDRFPRTPSGKIRKNELRRMAADLVSRAIESTATKEFK